ncbi:AAA family ATPase [Chloroflexota bacterium]
MAIITISRGSYSRGKEIAEKAAKKLGYECIDREIIIAASEHYNIPEMKLVRAIHDAPSILERFGYSKEKYITFFKSTLLHHLKKDNVIYHGLAGHFLLEGVPHVLKVRILSDMEDRIVSEMEREKISREQAQRLLLSDDQQRRGWSKYLFGVDIANPSLYDMVLHISTITPDDAVDIICDAVGLPHFQSTAQSQKVLQDLLLACNVKIALLDIKADADVSARDGIVFVKTSTDIPQENHLVHEIKEVGGSVLGVKKINVNIHPSQDPD